MDILVFALFVTVCTIIFWAITWRMTNRAIKQMREHAEQAVADMRAETDELIKEILSK